AGKHDAVERLADDFRRQHATSPLRPAADHVLATSLIALGKFSDAVAPLESYLAAEGKSEDAWAQGQLAVCHAQTGQLDRAKELFRTLARNHAEHEAIRPTTRALAEAALRAGDPDWAAELFGTLTDDSQSSGLTAKGLSGLAWSQFKAGKLELAAATFERLLEQAPAGELAAEASLARGQILGRLGQAEQALSMYQRVIAEHPQSVQLRQALLGAARLHDQLQQDALADALYARLEAEFSDHPRHDGVVYEWAWVQRDLGRHGEADALFERLRGQAPRGRYWADAVYRLAERALDSNELDRALELAEELLAGDAGGEIRPHALWLTAQVAIVREQWDQATQPLERLVAEFPEHPLSAAGGLADYYLAESAYRQEDLAAAEARFARLAEQALGRREKWLAMVPLRRAQILAQQKRWREALESAQAIAAEFPGFEQQYEADYVIGRALASLAEFDRAREAYLRVTRSPTGGKTETAAMAQWMIGESYFHQRNYQAALRAYLRVEILYDYPTWQAGALLQAGKCHELLGDWQQAEKLYERIVKLYTETDFTDEAGRRLQAAQARRMPPEPRQAKGLVP
ncbi:MAG: tetratricopeptide repeat protein, partial [Pirellulales bacterium]